MVPVAGSAYTYAYATLGELFAWIIGWDLILEYAVGAATVATAGRRYFQSVHAEVRRSAARQRCARRRRSTVYDRRGRPLRRHRPASSNLPADPDRVARHGRPGEGHPESASFNAAMVLSKLAIVLVRDRASAPSTSTRRTGIRSRRSAHGVSFFGHTLFGETAPGGEPVGMLAGAAIIFFAYIGFDSVSTHAEEAKNPQRDVPIGIIASLMICTVLYIAVVGGADGMVPYDQINIDAPACPTRSSRRPAVGGVHHRRRPAWPASRRCCW